MYSLFCMRRAWLALLLSACCWSAALGQTAIDSLPDLRSLIERKDWSGASAVLGKAYHASPGNPDVYHQYLSVLIESGDYKAAKDLVSAQSRYSGSPTLQVDLGRIAEAAGKKKQAEEEYENAIALLTGDEITTEQVAAAFIAAGRGDFAIRTYERIRTMLQNPYLYASPLARLYAKSGDVGKAVDALLTGGPSPYGGPDDTKATLLELLGNDAAKLQAAQKAIIRRINLQPENTYYADLLTWLYTQKGDWDGALLQTEAIDERNNAGGQNLLQFAQMAEKEGQYDIVAKSLDAVIAYGREKPYYTLAKAQRLAFATHRLEDAAAPSRAEAQRLSAEYAAFLSEFPQYNASDASRDWAKVEAEYNDSPAAAIRILKHAIAEPAASREFIGRSKLQIGDYQILTGDVWEASLTYSQVDKAFREDALGEEARFRNGKLAYYRGDFGWAQGQLSVLKASTSELIANDALYLSVLITENTPDSNVAALRLFARADLLLFQHKYAQATAVLDSIATQYPKHALQDDVLMLRASLAQKQHDYKSALAFLEKVYKDYGKDVLADDAVFRTAEIYERTLKQPAEAKKFYEQLIIDYPGSTYAQVARNRLAAMVAGSATP